jgi:hypothetical protein
MVERVFKSFQETLREFGWELDGSYLWEQAEGLERSYYSAKYDVIYALLEAVKEETGEDFSFIIDARGEEDDYTEFLIYKGNKVLGHYYFRPTVMEKEPFEELIEEILKKIKQK